MTEVDVQDRKVAADLEIEDRVFKTSAKDAYETVKDHKPNFMNNPACRDINPCKPELGKVSKKILSEIILTVREKTGYNQWKNTDSVISWFKNLRTTARSSFIQCDICEYYPSITPELLRKAIIWARKHCDISADDERVIFQARKSFLFYKGQPWVKTKNEDFDVTMGSYDGAEVCDLVGLYLLSQLQHLNVNVGAFRDDWLMHGTLPPRQLEGVKKELCRIFKDNGLRITIEANISNVNFLDVNLDLTTHTYKPYMKPNQTPLYVHKSSNHPPHILKNIPLSIERRLSKISANEKVFNEAIPPYQKSLRESGYDHVLKFNPPNQNLNPNSSQSQPNPSQPRKRARKRHITWFNPPYSLNVKTNVGAKFLKIIDK